MFETGRLSLVLNFSAKVLVKGEPNVAYICSRYYRAPELIFGATDYTSNIGRLSVSFFSLLFYCLQLLLQIMFYQSFKVTKSNFDQIYDFWYILLRFSKFYYQIGKSILNGCLSKSDKSNEHKPIAL